MPYADKEYGRQHAKEYREKNKEKIAIRRAEYIRTHKNEKREYDKKYREKNRERRRQNTRNYYNNNKESVKKYVRQWEKSNPRNRILYHAKIRAKKKNIEFNINLNDVPEIPETCSVLGIKIFQMEKIPGDNSPSIDRIINENGYVSGNVRIISNRANSLKSNATLEEMELILEDAIRCLHSQTPLP